MKYDLELRRGRNNADVVYKQDTRRLSGKILLVHRRREVGDEFRETSGFRE